MSKPNAALKEAARPDVEGVRPDHPAAGVNRVVDADNGTIEMLMPDGVTPRKKFALVGFAGSTRAMAPYDELDWAIVGLNQLNRHVPRADAWFEIHKEWNTALVPGTDHAGWLRDCGIPVLMAERVPGLPTSVRLPIEPLIEQFTDYFTSTVAYMVAYFTWHIDKLVEARMREAPSNGLASAWDVAQLAKTIYAEYAIGIFGIDLIVGEEYEQQRPCAEFYIGHALARGITVMIPPQSALAKQRYRYGYQVEPDDLIKLSDIDKRAETLKDELAKHETAAAQLAGAMHELKYMREVYVLRERGGVVG